MHCILDFKVHLTSAICWNLPGAALRREVRPARRDGGSMDKRDPTFLGSFIGQNTSSKPPLFVGIIAKLNDVREHDVLTTHQ